MQIYQHEHNVFVIRSCGRFFGQTGTFDSKDFKLKKIVGIISHENYLGHTKQDEHLHAQTPFLETLSWTGEWIGLFFDDASQTGLFSTDFFGFGQIFYSIVQKNYERILIVGDSFRGVSHAVKKIVGQTNINWHVAMPHLVSSVTIFSTRCSYETFSQDIQVLHNDEVLLFNQEGVSITKKPISPHLKSLTYEQLLHQGIEKIGKTIKYAVNLNCVNELSLSGGKDSRAVLGLIVASGYHKNLSIYTAPSSGVAAGASREILDKDFSLSCRLAEYFGLGWNTNHDFDEYNMDFDEVLNHWQNFRANSAFNLRPQSTQIIGKREVRFTGGGGEVLRHSVGKNYKEGFSHWWANCGKTAETVRQDLGALFRNICPFDSRLDDNLYQKSLRAFVNAMDFGDGQNVLHQLNTNDRKYDNRCHFSVAKTNYAQGALLCYPLCVPEFVYAMGQLPYEEQEQGKTLFDILEYTVPELNTLEYASPAWNENLKTRGGNPWVSILGTQMAQQYPNLINSRNKTAIDRGLRSFNFASECQKRLVQNMTKLRDFSIDNQLWFFDGLTELIARLQQRSEQHLFSMVSKTETLLDIIEDSNIYVQFSELDLRQTHFKLSKQLSMQVSPYWSDATNRDMVKFTDVCEQIDMSDFCFSGSIDVESKNINVVFSNIKPSCQIACYLYEDGEKIDQIWYQECSAMQFNVANLDMSKRYRLTVFYKWANENIAQKTESLTLN